MVKCLVNWETMLLMGDFLSPSGRDFYAFLLYITRIITEIRNHRMRGQHVWISQLVFVDERALYDACFAFLFNPGLQIGFYLRVLFDAFF